MTANRVILAMFAVLLCNTACEDKKQAKDVAAPGANKEAVAATPKPEDAVKKDLAEVASSTTSESIAARFSNQKTIAQKAVMERIKLLPEKVQKSLPLDQLYNLVLFVMIQEQLSYSAAVKEGYDRQDHVKHELEHLRDNIAQQYYLDQEGEKAVTEAAVKAQYEELIKDFKPEEEVGLRHILVKTDAEAKDVLKRLAAGEQFDALQQTVSLDRRTLEKKGFLGYFRKKQLPKNEADAILKTNVGSVVPVAIEVPKTGFSVLMVTEKRKSTPATLQQVRARIENILKKKQALNVIEKLYKKNDVVLFEPDGSKRSYQSIDERLEAIRDRQDHPQDAAARAKEKMLEKLENTTVVARVGAAKQDVTFAQISQFIEKNRNMFQDLSPYEVYTSATEEYVNNILLSHELEKANVYDIPEVKQRIENATHALVSQNYLSTQAEKMLTKERLHQEFDALMARFDKNDMEVSLKMIPVKSKEEGNKAIAALKKGDSFDSVMDKFCADQRFRDNHGEMGYLRKGQLKRLSQELFDAVMRAPKATILPTPIEVNKQILVVRVQDKKPVDPPTFAQTESLLKKRLLPECMIKITLKLIESDNVQAFDFGGKALDLSEQALEQTLGNAPTPAA